MKSAHGERTHLSSHILLEEYTPKAQALRKIGQIVDMELTTMDDLFDSLVDLRAAGEISSLPGLVCGGLPRASPELKSTSSQDRHCLTKASRCRYPKLSSQSNP